MLVIISSSLLETNHEVVNSLLRLSPLDMFSPYVDTSTVDLHVISSLPKVRQLNVHSQAYDSLGVKWSVSISPISSSLTKYLRKGNMLSIISKN